MTFEQLRNGVAEAVRLENKKLPFGEAVSYEKMPMTFNGEPVRYFDLVKTKTGWVLDLS